MEQHDLLRYAVEAFEGLRMDYVVTGSMAAAFFGHPRYARDIDMVVDVSPDRLSELLQAFPTDEFDINEAKARQAVQRRGRFQVLYPSTGARLDLRIADKSPFTRSRFARARRIEPFPEFGAVFDSVEDIILEKMNSYRKTKMPRHLKDITGILETSGEMLDYIYLQHWIDRLGLDATWDLVGDRIRN